MKVIFLAAGTDILASSRTRVYQYFPYLRREGIYCKVINFTSEGECRANMMRHKRSFARLILDKSYSFLQLLKFLFCAPGYDVVVVQKVLLPNMLQATLKFLNKNLIFDFDDAIFIKDIYKNNKFIKRFIHMISQSKYVILENDFTKGFVYKYNKNILMITGPIDVCRYSLRERKSDNSKVTIGWIGSQDTVDYLKPLHGVLQVLSKKYSTLRIGVIGPKELNLNGVNLIIKEWSLDAEVSNLYDFDIGIMPLFEDNWSMGKGGYKLLQYMSIGIPCVASPVGINQKIVRDGINGYLARTQKEWEERLSTLIENYSLRLEMGLRGREIAVKEYSFESSIGSFVQTLNQVSN